jgi:tetratricopeptide (TPR) repeat protein
VTCQQMKDYSGAIRSYETCLGKSDVCQRAPGLGEAYRALGDLKNSLEHLNQAIALKPDSDWFHRERGNTYRTMGNEQLAEADFAKMRELQQNQR